MGISFSNFSGTSSSSTGTGFNLDVGSSGNNTFVFDTVQDAGGYSITSQLTDATLEFYAIAEDGTLAGYTNNKALVASKAFSKLVVYGASANDLITFEFKPTALPTSIGQENSGAAPYVSNVSVTSLPLLDDTTVVTGGNFATDVTVTFTGTDSVVRNAKSVVRTNSTQLIVTRPDDAIEDYAPYTMSVINPGVPNPTTVSFTETVTVGSDPVWSTTAGSLPDGIAGDTYSTTISASDPDGEPITYSIVSGQLPSGLSLSSSTGEISGTGSLVANETFTIRASDPEGNYADREFSLILVLPEPDTIEITSSQTVTIDKIYTAYIFGGGGGGGGSGNSGEGGGGGSGYLTIATASPGTYTVTIGAGGTAGVYTGTAGGQGGTTSFGSFSATGGSGGNGPTGHGGSGGSGGGAGSNYPGLTGFGAGGFNGGNGGSGTGGSAGSGSGISLPTSDFLTANSLLIPGQLATVAGAGGGFYEGGAGGAGTNGSKAESENGVGYAGGGGGAGFNGASRDNGGAGAGGYVLLVEQQT